MLLFYYAWLEQIIFVITSLLFTQPSQLMPNMLHVP